MVSQSVNTLFHSRTLNNNIRGFSFPSNLEERHQKLTPWIEALRNNRLDRINEVSLHGSFLNDVFVEILGYCSIIQGEGKFWELDAERTIPGGGGTADAVLGFFRGTESKKGLTTSTSRVIAPIELKGTKEDLNRPASGRRESAVEQGWRYANYTQNCRWVIVSNYREIRLYQTSKTPAYYEQFQLKDLADIKLFKQFYFLLCRENFLPVNESSDISKTDQLLISSNKAQEEITEKLYKEYKEIRLSLVRYFQAEAPKDILNRDLVLVSMSQKVLDRILFIAFCESKGLLPKETLKRAHDHKDPYNQRQIWNNYKAVFGWVDTGNNDPPISGYNGGLFKHDPLLDDQLQVSDSLCTQLQQLVRFDFDTEVSVDILGHIFEQSITDLEELHAIAAGCEYDQKKSQRRTQGVFYTPAFVTQYIVNAALGGYLSRCEQKIRDRFELDKIPARATRRRQLAEISFWEAYRDEVLLKTRVVDPACGSGAFLLAAFDYLAAQYERVNEALAALIAGQRSLFDLNKTILNNNLYGVDISPEAVEITKLSLWLKTAEQGKTLTYLDNNIKVGDSIVNDPATVMSAFDWEESFPQVFASGGFDLVIGNPPYVRQEFLSSIKPYLKRAYESYDGVADLYIYFYEKGIKILQPGGVLSYIVTNKWLRAKYGSSIRSFMKSHSIFEQIIDFGHAPIFADADTFPCIVVAQRLSDVAQVPNPESERSVTVCSINPEHLKDINLTQYVNSYGFSLPWSRFTSDTWNLEPRAISELMKKIQQTAVPLKEYIGVKPLSGIKTGLNEAFLIDNETKNTLVAAHPSSTKIIKPYLRGEDIKRWHPKWQQLWMILLKSSNNCNWPWSNLDPNQAELVFSQTYPSIYQHMKLYESPLKTRLDRGIYWWELRSCIYYQAFEQPKFIYQEINTFPAYAIDFKGLLANNKVFLLPTSNLYVLACLNSPLGWWIAHRLFPKMIADTITPRSDLMINFPIALATEEIRLTIEPEVKRLIEITSSAQETRNDVFNWLHFECGIKKPGEKLSSFASLDINQFIQEIKKRSDKSFSPLNPALIRAISQIYNDYVPVVQSQQAEIKSLELKITKLVNQAYALNPEEIALVEQTSPRRTLGQSSTLVF